MWKWRPGKWAGWARAEAKEVSRLLGCLRLWLGLRGLLFFPAGPCSPGISRPSNDSDLRVGGEKGLPGQLKRHLSCMYARSPFSLR